MSGHSQSSQNSPRESRINDQFSNEINQQNRTNNNFQNLNFQVNRPLFLREQCYPSRTVQPSAILFPPAEGNNFELKSSFINGVPKFTSLEKAYEFLQDFQFYTSTLKMQQLSDESIKLCLIPFALQSSAKRWLNSLPPYFIRSWNEFNDIFVKKFFPSTKLLKLEMKSINSLKTKEKHFHNILNDLKNSCIVALVMESPKLSYAKWHIKGLTIQLESSLKPCAKMIL